jgi:hypothetical protein
MSISQTSTPPLSRKVFIRDNIVFTSLTSDYLPDIPRPVLELDSPFPSLVVCQKPRWVDPRYYSLAYTPVSPRYDKPFDILKLPGSLAVDQFRSTTGGFMYRTPPVLRQALEQLERELLQIEAILSKHITLVGLEFRPIPSPESCGYRRAHKLPRYATRAIKESRDAFVALMAWISYLITAHDRVLVEGGPGKPDFRLWENMLIQNGCPQDRVQELKNSEINIFDASYPRAGVFINYTNFSFHSTMRLCIKNKIPVWVAWDGKGSWKPDVGIQDHLPTTLEYANARTVALAEIEAARRRQEEEAREAAKEVSRKRQEEEEWEAVREATKETALLTNVNSWHSASPAQPAAQDISVPKIPIPHTGSRQKYGETPAQFLKCMAEDRTRRMASENAAQRQRRESREEAQRKHQCPGSSSKAPLVFHWEVDVETGIRMRTQVYRAAVDQIWAGYSNKQRVFDWFHNEWDVCSEFDPDAKCPDGDDVDDDMVDFDMGNVIDPHPSPPISNLPANVMQAAASPLSPASLPAASCNEDNLTDTPPSLPASSYDEDDSTDTLSSVVFVGGLLDILYERYGFLNPGSDAGAALTSSLDWTTTRSILGLISNAPLIQELLSYDNLHRNNGIQSAISHFIQYMLDPVQTIPAALYDIHPESPEPLAHNPHFHIFKRNTKLENDASPADVYFVQLARGSDGMEVMLRDPATVLECYRRFDTLHNIIAFLFMNGRPFYTFLPQHRIPQPQPARMTPSPTLGYYPKDYNPGLREYRYYERVRKEFCSLPRARAALTRGNIIWRLALESIGVPAEEIVSDGPSEEVFTHGTCITNLRTSDVLWDDELSEEEKDLMCGVYRVFTGESFSTTFVSSF